MALRKYRLGLLLSCLLLVSAAQSHAAKKADQAQTPAVGGWTALGGGIEGTVNGLAVVGSQVIAAGDFDLPASNIAAWDGTAWSALGPGLNDQVFALTVHNNQLVAAGPFTSAGPTPLNHVAVWDGTSWSQLGPGYDPPPSLLASYGGRIFAGINYPLPNSAATVQAWNGATWQQIRSFFPGPTPNYVEVTALDVAVDKLFIGGLFPNGEGFVYDGVSVASTGTTGEWIRAYAAYDGAAYSGGFFHALARWNGGTSWTFNIGGSSSWDFASTYAIVVYNGALVIAGGLGPEAPNQYLATWNGTSWGTLGTGVNGGIYELAVINEKLIAAGTFTTADGNSALNIAQWSEAPVPIRQTTLGGIKALYRSER